ncbi:hypothetical protein K461DRAFT_283452 [Myriangium duriaei CBS 260.36]|uniref:Uncharacterized protein n=1 Tax=Myriangium duriaei CBS 260.36 TaxID=1168546 RepID=A0A9P4IPS8_9PEZI|nr:hypothetical protein K461DRAFT_283452 [Myriangium duriaei CBS 260.36]
MRYLIFIVFLFAATLLFLTLFTVWADGICNMFRSTCGTIADRAIGGWRHGTRPHHRRYFVPGKGWEVEYNITHEELLEAWKQIEPQVVPMPPINISKEQWDRLVKSGLVEDWSPAEAGQSDEL